MAVCYAITSSSRGHVWLETDSAHTVTAWLRISAHSRWWYYLRVSDAPYEGDGDGNYFIRRVGPSGRGRIEVVQAIVVQGSGPEAESLARGASIRGGLPAALEVVRRARPKRAARKTPMQVLEAAMRIGEDD